jgi:hypothetical protein
MYILVALAVLSRSRVIYIPYIGLNNLAMFDEKIEMYSFKTKYGML